MISIGICNNFSIQSILLGENDNLICDAYFLYGLFRQIY